jgi:anti-sigma regulatory factor (Ser/Thr protein kinase)
MPFGEEDLPSLRAFVSKMASALKVGDDRRVDIVVAVNEIATNSVRYGGGGGILRAWSDGGRLVCEVRDDGHIEDPMAGRRAPGLGDEGGFGLWLATNLSDLIQIRSFPSGSVVRLHFSIR